MPALSHASWSLGTGVAYPTTNNTARAAITPFTAVLLLMRKLRTSGARLDRLTRSLQQAESGCLTQFIHAAFHLLRDWLTGGDRYLRHQRANFLGLGGHRVQHLLPISRLQLDHFRDVLRPRQALGQVE